VFPETIETDRLRLAPRRPENVDLDACYRVCSSDPEIDEVAEHVTWDPHETKKETREFLERGRERWEEGEAASCVIRPRGGEDGAGYLPLAAIGAFLFRHAVREATIAPDLVTALLLAGAVYPAASGAVGGAGATLLSD